MFFEEISTNHQVFKKILDMKCRLMSLIFLLMTSSKLGSVNGSEDVECYEDDDCRDTEEYACCDGKCYENCG